MHNDAISASTADRDVLLPIYGFHYAVFLPKCYSLHVCLCFSHLGEITDIVVDTRFDLVPDKRVNA